MTMKLRKRVKFEFKDLEGPVDTLYPTLIIDLKCTACAVKKHHSANVEDTQLYYWRYLEILKSASGTHRSEYI